MYTPIFVCIVVGGEVWFPGWLLFGKCGIAGECCNTYSMSFKEMVTWLNKTLTTRHFCSAEPTLIKATVIFNYTHYCSELIPLLSIIVYWVMKLGAGGLLNNDFSCRNIPYLIIINTVAIFNCKHDMYCWAREGWSGRRRTFDSVANYNYIHRA